MTGKASVIVIFVVLVIQLVSCARIGRGFSQQDVCQLPMAKGYCRALIPRWWFDSATGKCREFNFGGCDGNANNFMTKRDCMETCAGAR